MPAAGTLKGLPKQNVKKEIKKYKNTFCRHHGVKSFRWFIQEPKSATEVADDYTLESWKTK